MKWAKWMTWGMTSFNGHITSATTHSIPYFIWQISIHFWSTKHTYQKYIWMSDSISVTNSANDWHLFCEFSFDTLQNTHRRTFPECAWARWESPRLIQTSGCPYTPCSTPHDRSSTIQTYTETAGTPCAYSHLPWRTIIIYTVRISIIVGGCNWTLA